MVPPVEVRLACPTRPLTTISPVASTEAPPSTLPPM